VSIVGRPALPGPAFSELVKRCAQPGVGEVRALGSAAGLVISASWAAHRRRRWTQGPVALSRSSDAARLAAVVVVEPESVGLTAVEPDADLSW
ncbi:MAG: hypothetical protein ABWY93_28885, partial [Mycobacterium sp.]